MAGSPSGADRRNDPIEITLGIFLVKNILCIII